MIWIVAAGLAGGFLALLVFNLTNPAKVVRTDIEHLYDAGSAGFIRSMNSLLGPALLGGNRITPLYNGEQIFPAMLAAIAAARRSITFETYIYWSGEVGRRFSEALSERARAGVKVHVVLDWVGSGQMDQQMLDGMANAGVEIEKYHPPRWYTLGRFNNRTHRKLLVVDGRIGFTGGVGIADKWDGHAQDIDHWRDSHFQLEGPAVAQMQAAFLDNWLETRGTLLHGDDYFPPIAPAGGHTAQLFRSSATDGSESVRLMYLLSIASASRNIRIANAYFVPDAFAVRELVQAAQRGVSVELIVPGQKTDAIVVRWASRALWGELLQAGVKIFEYQPTMYHVKVMVVDDCWTTVGSTNFDNRSFRLNAEANLNIMDGDVAREQGRAFEADKAKSRAVTYAMWRTRPVLERVGERVSLLFRAQL
jgi:cardiolipin synthase